MLPCVARWLSERVCHVGRHGAGATRETLVGVVRREPGWRNLDDDEAVGVGFQLAHYADLDSGWRSNVAVDHLLDSLHQAVESDRHEAVGHTACFDDADDDHSAVSRHRGDVLREPSSCALRRSELGLEIRVGALADDAHGRSRLPICGWPSHASPRLLVPTLRVVQSSPNSRAVHAARYGTSSPVPSEYQRPSSPIGTPLSTHVGATPYAATSSRARSKSASSTMTARRPATYPPPASELDTVGNTRCPHDALRSKQPAIRPLPRTRSHGTDLRS